MKTHRIWHKSEAGLTLIELLLAATLFLIILSIAGTGLIVIINANKRAEAETMRRVTLNRALNFIADDIRMASRINSTSTTGTTTATTAAINSGLYGSIGSNGTIVLYLEILGTCVGYPFTETIIYDIRGNTGTWLGPLVINRYGRIPKHDGSIDCLSSPQPSIAVVDAIVSNNINPLPTCNPPGVLSGAGGFYACVNGAKVDLTIAGRPVQHWLSNSQSSDCTPGTPGSPYCVVTTVSSRVMH